jgi:hypothetical protein
MLQRLTTHTAIHLVRCITGTYCNHFTERLQYAPPMATKLVVLQSCVVVLEVNPCSVGNLSKAYFSSFPRLKTDLETTQFEI